MSNKKVVAAKFNSISKEVISGPAFTAYFKASVSIEGQEQDMLFATDYPEIYDVMSNISDETQPVRNIEVGGFGARVFKASAEGIKGVVPYGREAQAGAVTANLETITMAYAMIIPQPDN